MILPLLLLATGFSFQTAPPTPSAPTPADAPLPAKGKLNVKGVNSELAGDVKEDGVMSFARYEGGSLALKPNRVTAYVNEKEVVLVQSKQRFAIPVTEISRLFDGNGTHAQVGQVTGASLSTKATANQTVVGIVWADAGKKEGIVVRVDKGDFAAFVSALESVTGLKATNPETKDH